MNTDYILVLITVPTEESAKKVASHLLEQKLAACVNIIPGLTSLFWWKGNINDDQEMLLIAKTHQSLFAEKLIPAVRQVHPYDVPEIIALPILMGNTDYLKWIEDVISI